MDHGRIYFECLDSTTPAGGVRRIYRHAEILNNNGFDAVVLHHRPGFKVGWFESAIPIAYWNDSPVLHECDTLVIPEGHVGLMRSTANESYRRVVLALNWSRIFLAMKPGESWSKFGISHVVAGSVYEKLFIKATMGIDSTAIVSGIDTALFYPTDKLLEIAFMPQKDVFGAHIIECIYRCQFPEFHDVQFVAINGLSHEVVAKKLSKAAMFLAQTTQEGLSRKMLEAMACGCIVVGFAGRGSAECMRNGENCVVVPDGDLLGAAMQLGAVTRALKASDSAGMMSEAVQTARAYSLEREEDAVVRFWSQFYKH